MSRDEERYPKPEVFMPERFLQEDGSLNEDNVPWAFGFGRRIWCVFANIGRSVRVSDAGLVARGDTLRMRRFGVRWCAY